MSKSFLHLLTPLLVCIVAACQQQDTRPLQRASGTLALTGWRIDTIFRGEASKSYLIDFVNEQRGYAISTHYGDIFRTSNGGESWMRQSFPAGQNNNLSFSSLHFPDEQHGYISVQNNEGCPALCKQSALLLITENGGDSWQLIETNQKSSFYEIHFSSLTQAVGLSVDGLFGSEDGGKTWQLIPGVSRSNYVNRLQFITASEGFLWGKNSILYQTTDGGKTWQSVVSSLKDEPFDFQFVGPTLGYAATFDGFYKTEDSGKNWIKILDGRTNLVGFPTAQEGFVIQTIKSYPNDVPDEDRRLLYTQDAADTFTESNPVHNLTINQAAFPAANAGYIAQGAFILKLQRQ